MQRVAVTGSSGFVGSHLVDELARRGLTVLALDLRPPRAELPPGARFAPCDVLAKTSLGRALQEFEADALVHLAARTDVAAGKGAPSVADYAANDRGVETVLDVLAKLPAIERAVLASTIRVWDRAAVPPSDLAFHATTAYGESKVAAEQLWRRRDGAGKTWLIVRPVTIWGPRMAEHYVHFLRLLRRGLYVHLGGPPLLKPLGYVENTVHQLACLLAAPHPAVHRRTFFLGDYPSVPLSLWASCFQTAMGAPPIRTLPLPLARLAARAGDTLGGLGLRRIPFDSTRLGNLTLAHGVDYAPIASLCGAPPLDLESGVQRTLAWLRDDATTTAWWRPRLPPAGDEPLASQSLGFASGSAWLGPRP
ncbi:MAG: NAD(P)-dependent oxidoreductase [Deltaproteobacteria bacterium]|nr:NAD(P)-dependent oxidoreductase [Deltaproteobacteria bacterium]